MRGLESLLTGMSPKLGCALAAVAATSPGLSPGNTPEPVSASGGISVLGKHQVTATQLQQAQGSSLFLKLLSFPPTQEHGGRAGQETAATQLPVPGSPPASLPRTGSEGCRGQCAASRASCSSAGWEKLAMAHCPVLGTSCGVLQGSGLGLVLCNPCMNHLAGG